MYLASEYYRKRLLERDERVKNIVINYKEANKKKKRKYDEIEDKNQTDKNNTNV